MGVEVGVMVDVNVGAGEGKAVADEATVGVEGEAATAVPQAFRVSASVPRKNQ